MQFRDWRRVMRLTASMCTLVGGWAAGSALAQSGYTISTLKAPSSEGVYTMQPTGSGSLLRPAIGIDASDAVFGWGSYSAGYYIAYGSFKWTQRFDPYLVSWPAGTASSVSPVKVYKASGALSLSFSADARKVLISDTARRVYDTASKVMGSTLPVDLRPEAVNNAGQVLWNHVDQTEHGLWTPAGGKVLLPKFQDGSVVMVLNNTGDAAGAIAWQQSIEPTSRWRPITWRQGVPAFLDPRPNHSVLPTAMNDAGQVLVEDYEQVCAQPDSCLWRATQGVLSPTGAISLITPSSSELDKIQARGITNDGLVYGVRGYRAFFWKNGVFTDVTDMLRSKGVTLPVGSVVADVFAMNAKGSMVAQLRSATSSTSLIRLAARP